MKKQLIPSTNQFGNGVTQWADPPEDGAAPGGSVASGGSGFSWDNLVSNFGSILNGVGNIVGAANNSYHKTENINEDKTTTTGLFSFTNGTTLTVIVIGGIALIITLVLVLGKK